MTNKPQALDEQMIAADRKAIRRLRDFREWKRQPREPLIPEDAGREIEFAWGDAWDLGYAAAHGVMAAKVAELTDDECAICGLTRARHSMSSGYGVCQIYPVFRSKREMVERLLAPHPEAQQQEDKV